jgi:putative redox protein
MLIEIKTTWKGKMQFESTNPGGNLLIDAGMENEEKNDGYRPKALMLSSLAGCSGLDIVSLLKKMRAEVENLELDVIAELTDEHPKYYKKVHVAYKFYGSGFKKDKIIKAVSLSETKYCGVMEMFRQFAVVTTEIIYIER